jgi:hypothetical protein
MLLTTKNTQFQTSKAVAVFQPAAKVVATDIIYNSALEILNTYILDMWKRDCVTLRQMIWRLL